MITECCREELGPEHNYDRCNEKAEFILWGKLLPKEALGPRCYNHAKKHLGAAWRGDTFRAIYDLRPVYELQHRMEELDK